MFKTKLTAALLTVALIATLIAPAGATSSSFSDISDQQTAVNADVLRLMGVVDGVGSNQFNPQGTLTRGAFCKMLITYMGLTDQLALYDTRTLFTDVPASHWASSYVNLAASTSNGDGGFLVAGVGDGTFQPDATITFAQAVTLLCRVLGYNDGDAGGIWPLGYLNLASSMGLTQGLSLSADDQITRSQAAQLFVQALSSKTKDGTLYCDSLGTVLDDVMVLATNVTADNGQSGAIRTSAGTYTTALSGVNPVALQGRRGTMILNEKNQIITFLPDDSTALTVTLSANPQATYLLASDGNRYAIASTTPVYSYGTTSSETNYGDCWFDLQSGQTLSLFLEGGTVTAIYSGESQLAEDAVVVTGTMSRSQFYALAGGATDFIFLRNGVEIDVTDLAIYDVVTYDADTNSLVVSDLRISAVYESGSPNSTTPTSIHILGHDFPVLDSALAKSDNIKVGGTASFLLTADGSIAAMVAVSRASASTAYGIAGTSSVEVKLPAGGTITLTGSNEISSSNQGRLVTVSSTSAGRINTARITSNSAGIFDVKAMTLGGRTVAPSFALYEEVAGGAVTPLSITALDMDSIPSADIAAFRIDPSGNVDLIVLDGVTGDSYTYGKLVEIPADNSAGSMYASNRMVSVDNSGEGSAPAVSNFITTTPFTDGVFGGVARGVDRVVNAGSGAVPVASSVIILKEITGISRTDFFTVGDVIYVTANGVSYPLSSQVECYNEDSDSWVTLSALRSYSNNLTIYMDELSYTVRVVTATAK